MPIKGSFFDMADDQAPGEADRRNGLPRSKKARHGTRNMWRAFGRPLMALLSPLLAVTHYRRREVGGVPRRLTSASGRGANVGFGVAWLGRARPRPEPTAPHGSCCGYISIRAAAFEPRTKH